MNVLQEIHDRLATQYQASGDEMRYRMEQNRLAFIAEVERNKNVLAEKAGITLEEYDKLFADQAPVAAAGILMILKHSQEQGTPIDLEAAQKAYEQQYPSTDRKDTRCP